MYFEIRRFDLFFLATFIEVKYFNPFGIVPYVAGQKCQSLVSITIKEKLMDLETTNGNF